MGVSKGKTGSRFFVGPPARAENERWRRKIVELYWERIRQVVEEKSKKCFSVCLCCRAEFQKREIERTPKLFREGNGRFEKSELPFF